MIRVLGVIIPEKKHVRIALRSIYGIGNTIALKICKQLDIHEHTKFSDLDEKTITSIQKIVGMYEVEGNLRKKISFNIKRLCDIKSYVGLRHKMCLPVHGQRTKTNAKTRKKRRIK